MRKIPTANILILNTKDNTAIFDESVILPIAPVDENKWTNEQLKAIPTETLDVIKALSVQALDSYLEAEFDIQDGFYDDALFKAVNQKAMKKVVDTYKQASELPRTKGRGFEDSMPSCLFWHFIGGAG